MYVAPFSLSSFSVSHLHPSLPTYLYVHFSTLESFKLSSTWASRTSVHIHARVFRVFALVYVLVRLVASQTLANQPIIAYLFINLPLHFQRSIPSFSIVISYFYSVFFFLSSKSRTRIVPIIFVLPTCFSTNFIAITIRLHSDDRLILITIVYRFVKRVVYVG